MCIYCLTLCKGNKQDIDMSRLINLDGIIEIFHHQETHEKTTVIKVIIEELNLECHFKL